MSTYRMRRSYDFFILGSARDLFVFADMFYAPDDCLWGNYSKEDLFSHRFRSAMQRIFYNLFVYCCQSMAVPASEMRYLRDTQFPEFVLLEVSDYKQSFRLAGSRSS